MELRFFFSSNMDPDSAPMMVWEKHKVYIRGVLIKIGMSLKRERARQIVELPKKIGTLESVHKVFGRNSSRGNYSSKEINFYLLQ